MKKPGLGILTLILNLGVQLVWNLPLSSTRQGWRNSIEAILKPDLFHFLQPAFFFFCVFLPPCFSFLLVDLPTHYPSPSFWSEPVNPFFLSSQPVNPFSRAGSIVSRRDGTWDKIQQNEETLVLFTNCHNLCIFVFSFLWTTKIRLNSVFFRKGSRFLQGVIPIIQCCPTLSTIGP